MKDRTVALISIALMAGAAAVFSIGCAGRKLEGQPQILAMVDARNMGLTYLNENRLDEAELEFKKLIEIAPDEAMGYANLALVYLRDGLYEEAQTQISKALKLEPGDPDLRLILTEIYTLAHREEDALELLAQTARQSPDHVKTLYRLAGIYSKSSNGQVRLRAEKYLNAIVQSAPANIAARLQLVENLLRGGKGDPAAMHAEELRKQLPALPEDSVEFFDKAIDSMRAQRAGASLVPFRIFHTFLKETPLYQSAISDLQGQPGPFVGTPILTFSQNTGRDASFRAQARGAMLAAIRFSDATSAAGLEAAVKTLREGDSQPASGGVLAVADYDNDGDPDLYVARRVPGGDDSQGFLLRNDAGRFTAISAGIASRYSGHVKAASFADYDNDGFLDLYVAGSAVNLLYRNAAGVEFSDVAPAAGVADSSSGAACLFADLDHDGDIDLYLATRGANRFYRYNSDGTFTELAGSMGIDGVITPSRDAAIGDFDEDGDLDLFVVNEKAPNVLYTNLRQGRFEDVAAKSGLAGNGGSGAVAVGDYDNDGFLDLFVAALEDERHLLYRNLGDGTFEEDTRSAEMLRILQKTIGLDACFLDFDNDGYLDLLVAGKPVAGKSAPGESVAGKPDAGKQGAEDQGAGSQSHGSAGARGILLFHNDGTGKFEDMSSILPPEAAS